MDSQDRRAIEDLFARLAEAARQSPERDGEAEAFIRAEIARQPAAPYYMAQTIVVQSYALEAVQARIEELEQELTARPAGGGGLLGGLFGGGAREPARPSRTAPIMGATSGQPMGAPTAGAGAMSAPSGPWAGGGAGTGAVGMAARPGGGFLAGAAQTAMGVAGGLLLGNAIAGLFQGDEAKAAEAPPADEPADDQGAADGGDEGGGFFDSFFGGDEL
jgi:hypothetical protein